MKVLQFGEGNFLRAFVDWIFDIANEKDVTDLSVAIVKPRAGKSNVIETLKSQNFRYAVCLEGIKDGSPATDCRVVNVIADAFSPDDEASYERYILSPELRYVVSNTTEAGIRYRRENVTDSLPESFPAKVTNLLWRRFRHYNGDATKGLFFICCELIEDNGTKLREYVLRHAEENKLGPEFVDWVRKSCHFVDTLVDRIVSGKPENIEEIAGLVGFRDEAPVKGELYHLWVIGGKDAALLRSELPLDKAGLNVVFEPSVGAFRDKKVRILNGSHTGMVAIGLLGGCETVLDAFGDTDINRFVNEMVQRDVLPVIDGDAEELKQFSEKILERFLNPYIRHLLRSISLNSLSKWETRNFITVSDNWNKRGTLADYEIFSFAALMALYAPDSGFTPDDDSNQVEFIHSVWNDDDLTDTIRRIVTSGKVFNENFEAEVPGFSAHAAKYLQEIKDKGIRTALHEFLLSRQ